ncbi:MAG: CLCA_X family protein [Oleiphilaceae bacterium]|nr:CLCA_X family protein [Oleiphilaceae bacterium]
MGQALGPPSFVDVRRRFGFRSIAVGAWVRRDEQDRAAVHFYRALEDLMGILEGTEALISLRGALSFHYGIGGQPGVSAHYSPSQRCLALAKNAGPGSLAHEWFHALDHYLADKAFRKIPPGRFASSAWLAESPRVEHPLNRRLFRCFEAVLLSGDGQSPSELFRASSAVDEQQGQCYYSQPEELCARAFEAYVQDAGLGNAFLVRGTRATEEARLGLYPRGAHRERINQAFSDYFRHLGQALRREAARRPGADCGR